MIVLDVGSGIPKAKLTGTMLEIANRGNYIAVDRDSQCGPHILADAFYLPFRDGCVDVVICVALLEHLSEPFLAVAEVHRVLKSGGTCQIIAPFLAGYHGNERYGDYYRFTKDGLRLLFRRFKEERLERQEGTLETMAKLMFHSRLTAFARACFLPILCLIDRLLPGDITRGWYGVFQKVG